MTPDLAERMKASKGELLALLRRDDGTVTDAADRPADGHPGPETWDFAWSDKPPAGKSQSWCPRYGHPRAWRSIYGEHLICETCHPPVSDSVVAEWIGEPEAVDI